MNGMAATPRQAQHWRRTLWTTVGGRMIVRISFSILSPIMPLFLPKLGAASAEAVDIGQELASVAALIAIFTAPDWRPR